MIMMCTCIHADQDRLHGRQMRVFNQGKTDAKCTVCQTKKGYSIREAKDKRNDNSKKTR